MISKQTLQRIPLCPKVSFWTSDHDGHYHKMRGVATHCSIGPRGGRYVHIIAFAQYPFRRRSLKDVRML